MKRSKRQGTQTELKITVPPALVAVLDDYARAQGLSRADAVRMALYSAPQLARALTHLPVSARDVLGP